MEIKETAIRTSNVRTLYSCENIHGLTHDLKRYRWDIIGQKHHKTKGKRYYYTGRIPNIALGSFHRKERSSKQPHQFHPSRQQAHLQLNLNEINNITIIKANPLTSGYDDE
ncbi:hypothetical protein DPMN_118474 [Dreissena polymorpha]|uniref:Uncharacterized protein n=1 Tax=Dreissena polymorpha TaxID=45954 RepID=A0A9D4JNJ3_DREPO|nr:hypothetical protein DPMN_118474 [Dreissena polymorpha]